MESQAALFAHYRGLGWKIDETTIRRVSSVGDVIKYDVNVVSPDKVFGTAQYIDDNGTFTAAGFWKEQTDTFDERLRGYIRSLEGQGDIFSIVINDIFEADAAAVVTTYIGATNVTASKYIVKERNNTFSYRLIV